MSLFRSIGAVATASGDGSVDWDATIEAAIESTAAGSLDVPPREREDFSTAVRAAGTAVSETSGIDFAPPDSIELLNRHHWIQRNAEMFRRVLRPLDDRPVRFGDFSRRVNTATMATTLSVLSRHVQGQFDPFASDTSTVTVVRPNLRRTADRLDLEYEQFSRWVVAHELTHVAEFAAAPWLTDHIESQMLTAVERLASGELSRDALQAIDTTMTAVEGYAEAVLDRSFDGEFSAIRAAIDTHRSQRGPILAVLERVFGIRRKRRQYERGKEFFDAVFAARGASGAAAVWRTADHLPTRAEIDSPEQWLARVDP